MDSSGAKRQTKAALPLQGRANSELRNSPTRVQRGAAPKAAEELSFGRKPY